MKHIVAAVALAAMSFDYGPQMPPATWCAEITLGEDASYEDCRYSSFEEFRPNA